MPDKNKNDTTSRAAGNDAFWDLDALLPPRRPAAPFARDTSTVAVTVGEASDADPGSVPIPPPDPDRLRKARSALTKAEKKAASKRSPSARGSRGARGAGNPDFYDDREQEYLLAQQRRQELEARYRQGKEESAPPPTPPPVDPLLVTDYEPEDNPLLLRVSVFRTSTHSLPDPIFERALAVYRMPAPETEPTPVPYFAAIPSIEDLDTAQLACYLWWRERVRGGDFPEIDGAYLYLYLYETLNLVPTVIDPTEALRLLCRLWGAYRKAEPRLDYLIPEWICDLCLVHRLPLPTEALDGLNEIAIRVCSLKEFFLGGMTQPLGSPFAHAVYRYGCNYHWTESKFITNETRALFETHIPAAFLTAMTKLEEADRSSVNLGICSRRSLQTQMIRQSFAGSAFSREIKYRVEVTYQSCTRSVELRFMATDLVKYIENQLRRLLGIKSRFHTAHLDPRLKAAVDEYFAPFFAKVTPKKPDPKPDEPPPEWEALYEAKSVPFSAEEAKKIEKGAWSVTQRLVEAFAEEEAPVQEPLIAASAPEIGALSVEAPAAPGKTPQAISASSEPFGESEPDALLRRAFALLADEREGEFNALAKENRMLPLTLIEQMNEAALEELGDIAVEEVDGKPRLIEDYKEEIAQWMKL